MTTVSLFDSIEVIVKELGSTDAFKPQEQLNSNGLQLGGSFMDDETIVVKSRKRKDLPTEVTERKIPLEYQFLFYVVPPQLNESNERKVFI